MAYQDSPSNIHQGDMPYYANKFYDILQESKAI